MYNSQQEIHIPYSQNLLICGPYMWPTWVRKLGPIILTSIKLLDTTRLILIL